MRKIDVSDYQASTGPFQVRTSLAAVLFMEDNIPPRELIARDALARRIEQEPSTVVLLEAADYAKVVGGLNATNLKPYGRDAVEFVRRVLEAAEVDVVEKAAS